MTTNVCERDDGEMRDDTHVRVERRRVTMSDDTHVCNYVDKIACPRRDAHNHPRGATTIDFDDCDDD